MRADWEINQVTCAVLHSMLKKSIKGLISVKVFDDVLNINIKNDGFDFHYKQEDWIRFIMLDGELNKIANSVIGTYKSAVIKKYFY